MSGRLYLRSSVANCFLVEQLASSPPWDWGIAGHIPWPHFAFPAITEFGVGVLFLLKDTFP